jgi:outer membrane protein OmpA-like peptidoglycan-associated protein
MGSAQKLSLYRAETIEHYLLKQGIDQSRIEIKGWGGKKMLYGKHSAQAKQNVRVEVEITDN